MQTNHDVPVIAGHSAGKRIRCATAYMDTLERLRKAADQGSYWPLIAIRELNALASGMLDKAMQILVDQKVTLKGHTAYLAKAASSPRQALNLSHRLEMTLSESFADTGLSPRGAISQWRASGARFANKKDAYDREDHVGALVAGAGKVATRWEQSLLLVA